ncbi:Hint domain-containing protein [Acinetobacter chinensis]|uniref:Hint domain-containing protein n=1 Tax=Acinetobacter chinensis TaxID=2004650 RepID=UPI00293438CB|nr:Hint domain-containing protein [Acinetobacter chinensis]WOE40386.1 hypothetical protein QSG87_10780 [Acinetobacter chinensis]
MKEIVVFTGCFIAGTLVRIQRNPDLPHKNWKAIEDIQVGDFVLSRPKDGSEIQEYKPVINTFSLTKKPIWVIEFAELVENIREHDSSSHTIIATPNHLFWVSGSASCSLELNSFESSTGQWYRLDQLDSGDVLQDSTGKLYVVLFTIQLYQTEEAHIAWARDPDDKVDENGWKFDLEKIKQTGRIVGNYSFNSYRKSDEYGTELDSDKKYMPYLADVYSIDVQDYYTYFVGKATGIWVHSINCEVPKNPQAQENLYG